jgi:hypothetical protein
VCCSTAHRTVEWDSTNIVSEELHQTQPTDEHAVLSVPARIRATSLGRID